MTYQLRDDEDDRLVEQFDAPTEKDADNYVHNYHSGRMLGRSMTLYSAVTFFIAKDGYIG